jgi:carbon storage regulator
MLVLARKESEQIVIGEGIVLTVLRIEHGRVRIGIEAPPDVHVVRDELLCNPRSRRRARRRLWEGEP